jgi:hypothetical protein
VSLDAVDGLKVEDGGAAAEVEQVFAEAEVACASA